MTTQQRIQKVLGYTEKKYNLMIEYAGYSWLERIFPTDSATKMACINSARFWQWWTFQWKKRDVEFAEETSIRYINEPLTGDELRIALGFFVDKHDIKKLNIFPNRWAREQINELLLKTEAKNQIQKK